MVWYEDWLVPVHKWLVHFTHMVPHFIFPKILWVSSLLPKTHRAKCSQNSQFCCLFFFFESYLVALTNSIQHCSIDSTKRRNQEKEIKDI
jgi:hypothetical protein